MRYPFESPEAQLLNKQIFETIYHGALEASCDLAKEHGPYETYEGSPVSKGVSIWINFYPFFILWASLPEHCRTWPVRLPHPPLGVPSVC